MKVEVGREPGAAWQTPAPGDLWAGATLPAFLASQLDQYDNSALAWRWLRRRATAILALSSLTAA